MLLGCVGVGGYLVAPVRLDEALEIETLRVCGLKLVWRGPPERAKARCTGRLEAKLWQGGARRELAVEHASGCFLHRRRGQRGWEDHDFVLFRQYIVVSGSGHPEYPAVMVSGYT